MTKLDSVQDLRSEHEWDISEIVGKDHTYVEEECLDVVRWDFGSTSLWISSSENGWLAYGMTLTPKRQKLLEELVGSKIDFS